MSFESIYVRLAVLICIRVLGGYTRAESAETVFDTDNFIEKTYVRFIHSTSGNISLALNWYVVPCVKGDLRPILFQQVQFFQGNIIERENHRHIEYVKVVGYFSVGYIQEAAELGFSVYQTRGSHPKYVLCAHHYLLPDSCTVIGMYVMLSSFTVLLYLHVSATALYHATSKQFILLKLKQMICT